MLLNPALFLNTIFNLQQLRVFFNDSSIQSKFVKILDQGNEGLGQDVSFQPLVWIP